VENVLVAVILMFLFMFGALTLTNASLSAEETVQQARVEMDTRSKEIDHTAIAAIDLRIVNAGGRIEVTLTNKGTVKLADFDRWDVFAEYYDSASTPVYHAESLTYSKSQSPTNTWSQAGIYLDKANNVAEAYEPNILNPGEELVLYLNVSPAVGVGQSAQVTVATDNGTTASIMGTRNAPPTLALNTGLKVANTGSGLITPESLLAQDTDSKASELSYSITTPPTQGTLTPQTSFTQAQIDNGEVSYTHTGTGADSLSFTISDGIDVIGPFTYSITINQLPVLETNAGLTLPSGTSAAITNALLQVTDSDDPPEKLIYTVTQFPANGALSLGSTFTQADIDNNRLSYMHTGTDADLFKFVVSDGYDVIGAYSFVIMLVESTPQPQG